MWPESMALVKWYRGTTLVGCKAGPCVSHKTTFSGLPAADATLFEVYILDPKQCGDMCMNDPVATTAQVPAEHLAMLCTLSMPDAPDAQINNRSKSETARSQGVTLQVVFKRSKKATALKTAFNAPHSVTLVVDMGNVQVAHEDSWFWENIRRHAEILEHRGRLEDLDAKRASNETQILIKERRAAEAMENLQRERKRGGALAEEERNVRARLAELEAAAGVAHAHDHSS
jgi:hypothetical protein